MRNCSKVFQTIHKNSLNIYVAIKKKRLSLTKLVEAIQDYHVDSMSLISSEFQLGYYLRQYTKMDCIDEVISYSNDRYYHLKEIRDVVNMDLIVDQIMDSRTYDLVFQFYYTRKLWELIFGYQDDLREFYVGLLEHEKKKVFERVMRNIDNYYITMITK